MKFKRLDDNVTQLLRSSNTFEIVASKEEETMKTVICLSSATKDMYLFQSSCFDNRETKVDIIRLTEDVYSGVSEVKLGEFI